jgi:hypothetical protein
MTTHTQQTTQLSSLTMHTHTLTRTHARTHARSLQYAEGLFQVLNKGTGTEQNRHHTVEVATYNIMSYLWEIETNKKYTMRKKNDVFSGLGGENGQKWKEHRLKELPVERLLVILYIPSYPHSSTQLPQIVRMQNNSNPSTKHPIVTRFALLRGRKRRYRLLQRRGGARGTQGGRNRSRRRRLRRCFQTLRAP